MPVFETFRFSAHTISWKAPLVPSLLYFRSEPLPVVRGILPHMSVRDKRHREHWKLLNYIKLT